MEICIFKHTSKMIVLTEQGKQEVLTYGYKNPIVVIPNGVDLSKFTTNHAVEKDIDVLFCGRIERRKGSHAMVDLCRSLIVAKPDINIVIVGYGDDEAWINAELAAYSRNVKLTGKVSFNEAISFYQRSRVYASTSYYEGLPGSCLEAMAMQLPVVVWDFLFYRGLVNQAETGFVASINDFQQMTDFIVTLLSDADLRAKLGGNARCILEKHYGWDKLAIEVLRAFEA